MAIVDLIGEMLREQASKVPKPETQLVVGTNTSLYIANTRKRGATSAEMTLYGMGMLTPYAGNGYGMVCTPRAGQKLVTLPVRDKIEATLGIGRIFETGEQIPAHDLGDFLIEHETHSKLLFKYAQPRVDNSGFYYGSKVTMKEDKARSGQTQRTFIVGKDDEQGTDIHAGDRIFVVLQSEGNAASNLQPPQQPDSSTKRSSWMAVAKMEEAGEGKIQYSIVLSKTNLTGGLNPVDYMDDKPESYLGYLVPPTKGWAEFSHYTGSTFYMDELMNYRLRFPYAASDDPKSKQTTRYNLNSRLADAAFEKDEDGNMVMVSKHRPKGKMHAMHYTQSALMIQEKECQDRAHAVSLVLQTQKVSPYTTVQGEQQRRQLPTMQFVMEDSTQDERDVASRAYLRHLTSAVIADDCTIAPTGVPTLKFQEESVFGIDDKHPEQYACEGSTWFVRDFLKKYDEGKKGWQFASDADAQKEYDSYTDKYFDGKDQYEIEYKKRIIPASGRRDVMRKREEEQTGPDGKPAKVYLVNDVGIAVNDENKEFLGQKGYTYKTGDPADIYKDGYLCVPKGAVGFRHYTRSGIVIQELEPDIGYHALQASMSLFGWDMGQYSKGHKYAEKRDSEDMTFGPSPLPMARLVMESAKFEDAGDTGKAVVPTKGTVHTSHPQPAFSEKDDSNRTTLATLGEVGTWVGLEQVSSQIQKTSTAGFELTGDRPGSHLLFKDYVVHAKPDDKKTPLISAGKWSNKRGEEQKLIAPKGAIELLHYTSSGLMVYDQRQHYLNKKKGGHAMALRLAMRSLSFDGMKNDGDPAKIFEQEDGAFFCQMLSNELVDKGEKYTYEIEEGKISEQDSVRGKKCEKAHGKRGAMTGFSHSTTLTEKHKEDCRVWFEDFLLKNSEEDDSLEGTIQPSHLYDKQEKGVPRKLIMPKGKGGIRTYTKTGLYFGDADTGEDVPTSDADNTDRGKKHRPYLHLYLQEWNNRQIENPKQSAAKPYEFPSASITMDVMADTAAYEGKDAARISLDLWSSTVKNERHGSSIVLKDFTGGASSVSGSSSVFPFATQSAGTGQGRIAFAPLGLQMEVAEDLVEPIIINGVQFGPPSSLQRMAIDNIVGVSNVVVTPTSDGVKISWDTAIDADSTVQISQDSAALEDNDESGGDEGGENPSQPTVTSHTDAKPTQSHSVDIKGLQPETNYFAKVSSKAFPSKSTVAQAKMPYPMPFPGGTDVDVGDKATHGFKEDGDGNNKRKTLTFPKGLSSNQLYNKSGLFMEDLEHEKLEKQQVQVKLAMREWDNSQPEEKGAPFPEDSDLLLFKELCTDATKAGKRASQILLHSLTSKAQSAESGSCLVLEDFVSGKMPSHIYDDSEGTSGLKKVKFPKGKVELKHYTGSGLYMWDDQQKGADKHDMKVQLRLRQWGESQPEPEDLAWIFASDTTAQKDQVAVVVGFRHCKTMSQFFALDRNTDKDKHRMQCGISHWDNASSLNFYDLEEDGVDGKQNVLVELQHHKKAGLKFENEQDNLTLDLYHQNRAGYKVVNQGGDTVLTIYHPSGSYVEINNEGTVTVKSVRDLIGTVQGDVTVNAQGNVNVTAGSSAMVKAPRIRLDGDVVVSGNLTVGSDVYAGGTVQSSGFVAPGGNWHPG